MKRFFFNLPSSHRHHHLHQNPNRDNSSVSASTSTSGATNPSYSSELRESASGRTEEEVSSYESANGGEVEEEEGGEEISPFRGESTEWITASASGQRNADGEDLASASFSMSAVARENKEAGTAMSARMDRPPSDDCCPICFSNFVVPCRGPCGHWYCGGCILQYWNYSAALQPCNCPMCSKKITKLTPEASLYHSREVEVIEVLGSIRKYNRLFVGGTYGFMLKVFCLPLYAKRLFCEMMNPDRPGAHLNKLRICAMFLGLLYTFCPFDFLRIGRQNVIDVFDYSAIALSFVLYLAGLYLRRRRFQNVREMAAIDP
nr:E3 ubiquitin-protein ligase RNF170-like [Ipomoea batatas]